MITAAIAIASPRVVSTVRTGRCRTFLMIREVNRTVSPCGIGRWAVAAFADVRGTFGIAQSLPWRMPWLPSLGPTRRVPDQDVADAPPDRFIVKLLENAGPRSPGRRGRDDARPSR